MATAIVLPIARKFGILSLCKSLKVKRFDFQHNSGHAHFHSNIKVAVVGSGPAGFYASQHILNHGGDNLTIDIFERLPVPFGLVRYGVAPDHPEVKNVENTFTNTAEDPRVQFFGNVAIGNDIKVSELLKAYHAVILAYGAAKDRTLDIPGEDLRNVISARSLVGYYNGLPEASFLSNRMSLDSHNTAVIIGLGNVALDVARILLTPVDILRKTDITDGALEMLRKSKIENVYIVGRRGPLHVSFTIKELREMVNLEGATPNFNKRDFHGMESIISKLTRPRKRLTELLVKTALDKPTDKQNELWAKGTKQWHLKLLRTPLEIMPSSDNPQTVGKIKLGINELTQGDINESQNVIDTGETETIDCGLVLRSIGYKSIPVESGIPFDEKRGIIPNENGKIADVPGLFCAGWLATGPRGVIVNTMNEAFKVGQTVLENIPELKKQEKIGYDAIRHLFHERNVKPVTFQEWKQIDSKERELGKMHGKPREKLTSISRMLSSIE